MKKLLCMFLLVPTLAFATPDFRISDTAGDVLNINSDGTIPVSFSGGVNLSDTTLEVPNSTTLPTTDCDAADEAGRVYVDTDATSGSQYYVCEGLAGWVAQVGPSTSPAGSGSELQYRASASEFGAASGSGVDSNGNIGIGSTAPGQKLDVQGRIRASAGSVSAPAYTGGVGANADTGMNIGQTTDVIDFSNAGVNTVTLFANGNVGIGTSTAPGSDKLLAAGRIKALGPIGDSTFMGMARGFDNGATANGSSMGQFLYQGSTESTAGTFSYILLNGIVLNSTEATAESRYGIKVRSAGASVETLSVAGANVGIGSITPGMTLDVQGEIRVSGVSGSGKAVCIKSTGDMGVCGDAVGAGGTCTCS